MKKKKIKDLAKQIVKIGREYDRKSYGGVSQIKVGVYLDWENGSIMKFNSYNFNVAPVQNWGDDEFPL